MPAGRKRAFVRQRPSDRIVTEADALRLAATGVVASGVAIEDAGNHYAGADVEAALQEVGALLIGIRDALDYIVFGS